MLRWCISPIVGTGESGDEFQGAVSRVAGVNSSAVIPVHTDGPHIGEPKFRVALCLVASANMVGVAAVSNLYLFPDYPLDGRMDGMEADARQGVSQSPSAFDLDGAGFHLDTGHVDSDSYRDVLNKIGRQFDPAFDLARFGVPEVAG